MRTRQQVRRMRRLTLIATALAVVIAAAAFFLLIFPDMMLRRQGPVLLPFADTEPHEPFGRGVLHIGEGKLTCYQADGSVKWTAEAPLDAQIACSDKLIVAYTAALAIIYDDNGRVTAEIAASSPILMARCGDGMVALLHEQQEAGRHFTIYQPDGKLLDDSLTYQGATVLDFGFMNQSEGSFWVSTLNDNGAHLVCQIITYNPEKPGKPITGLVTLHDELAVDVLFLPREFVVMATQHAQRFSYTGQALGESMLYGLSLLDSVVIGETAYSVLSPQQSTASYEGAPLQRLTLFSPQLGSRQLEAAPDTLAVFLTTGGLYTITPDNIISYSLQGERRTEQALPFLATSARPFNAGRNVLLHSAGSVYLLPLL